MKEKIELALLENLEKTLYAEHWKEDTIITVLKYKFDNKVDETSTVGIFLEKIIRLIARNRFVEARRRVQQEIENTTGLTEQICKRRKIRDEYCERCKNYNCNLNKNKEN